MARLPALRGPLCAGVTACRDRGQLRRRRVVGRRWLTALLLLPPLEGLAGDAPSFLPALTYEGTALSDLTGGLKTGATFVGNLHLKLTAQRGTLGDPGTAAFVDLLSIHGGQPTRLVGDAQDTSNIEGPVGTQLEEAWVQHNFAGDRFSVLAGLYDLNSEFYALQTSGLFLNGSFGIGPEFAESGVGGPSVFPRTSFGLRLAWAPAAGAVLRVALMDGVPFVRKDGLRAGIRRGDGALGVVEFAVLAPGHDGADRPAAIGDGLGRLSPVMSSGEKLAVGLWRYTGHFDDLSDIDPAGDRIRRGGSAGAYAVAERPLIGGAASKGHVSGFAQAGVADPRTNRFGTYVGAGLVGTGWGPMRDADAVGFAVARAGNGEHYQRIADATGQASRAETTLELSYLTRVGRWLTLQPDLQYVVHPNTNRAIPNAWVLQCRFFIDFSKS